MSLLGTLQIAGNALTANQIGLQVTGNNIANANTPGYIRQRAIFTPAPTQKQGDLLLGLGVEVTGVVQQVDKFLEARIIASNSDLASGVAQEEAYGELEGLLGELSDTDISTSLTNFFGSIHDVLNQPESPAVRNLAVLQAEKLTTDINRLRNRVQDLQENVNSRIVGATEDINRLLNEVGDLNVKIIEAEGGGSLQSDAVGLRDQRLTALNELSKIMNIRAVEQPDGGVTVFSDGDFVVFQGQVREVEASFINNGEFNVARIAIAETDKEIDTSSGELGGLITARDDILGGFVDQLDDFSETLIFEFNKQYSQGQGLLGHQTLTSEFAVDDTNNALDAAALPFTPVNGTLSVLVQNKTTGVTKTTDITIDLNGLDSDSSLEDIASAINGVDNISATITPQRKLTIQSDAGEIEFSFANDTSGVLAALGLNTFFTGTGAADIAVSSLVRENPSLFAASGSGFAGDTANAEKLASLLDTPLENKDGRTLADIHDSIVAEVTQGASVAKSVAEGFRVFQRSLENQRLAVSGVSIDEEAIKLIGFQRAFQASARVISTISDMLDVLVNL